MEVSSSEAHGYDEILFLSEPGKYLRCSLCELVLRDPLQVLTCGHKFCRMCYEHAKTHSQHNNNNSSNTFYCPVDRKPISADKVCEDIALQGYVNNLAVRCRHAGCGCAWNGEI